MKYPKRPPPAAERAVFDTADRQNRFLASLSQPVLRVLAPFLAETALEKDQYLFHQGEPIKYIYFPVSAVVSEFLMLEDGRTVELAIIGSEGATGVQSLMSDDTAVNSSQATIAGKALRVAIKNIDPQLLSNAGFLKPFHQLLEDQLAQFSQKLVCTSYHSVEQRFCTLLLRIEDRLQTERFELTHDQIARSLGAHRPSITAIAQELRDKQLFEYSRGRIRLFDRQGIQKLACSCYKESPAGLAQIVNGSNMPVNKN